MLIKGVKNIVIGSVMEYLLRAFTDDTGAADQGYSNAQVLDTAAEGVRDSSGTVNETDGTLALASTKLTVTAQSTPAWGDCGIVFAQRTAQQGKAFMLTVNSADYTKLFMAGWGGNGLALANVMCGFQLQTDKKIDFVSNGAVTAADLVTLTDSSDASFVLIPGGYDSNGVPFDTSKAIADYTYGGSLYWWNGSSWLLVWRTSAVACSSKEYPLLSFYNMAGTLSNLLIPDYDFSSVLQPIVLDTFTDTDGTSLADHTPDVCPVGSSWSVVGASTFEIRDNHVEPLSNTNANRIRINCNAANVFIECELLAIDDDASNLSMPGLALRDNGTSFYYVYLNSNGNTYYLYQYDGSNYTSRGSAAVTIDSKTYYNVKSICSGDTIKTFFGDMNTITYNSASQNNTETNFGLRLGRAGNPSDKCEWNNFAVWPLTSTTYDSEFSKSGYGY